MKRTRAFADAVESEVLGQTHWRGSPEPVPQDFLGVELATDRQRVSKHRRSGFEQDPFAGNIS